MSKLASSTQNVSILRRLNGENYANHQWKKDPYLSDIKKSEKGFSEGVTRIVRVAEIAGTSPDFATALANQNATEEKRFTVTEKHLYTIFSLDGAFMRKAKGKPNTLLKAYDSQARGAMREFEDMVAFSAWNHEGGAISQLAANTTLSGTTIRLNQTAALWNLNPKNKRLVFSSDNGTGSSPAGLRDAGASVKCTAVDFINNTLTVDTALSTAVPNIANTDYVFFEGMYNETASGKRAWNPITAPGSTAFFGVDRSTDVEKLSGWRVAAAQSMENTLIDAMVVSATANADMPKCYTNLRNWANLIKELGIKITQDADGEKRKVGFRGVEVIGPQGTCMVVGSSLVPYGYAWAGDPSTDEMLSEGECPQILNEDGIGVLMRNPEADNYQSRLGGDYNFLPADTDKKLGPGGWVIITWPTV